MSEEMKKELSEQEKEMLAKLAQAKTVEDVLAVAKEYGKEISEEEAKKTLEEINEFRASGKASGELSDDDLDNVAGGWTEEQQKMLEIARGLQEFARAMFPCGY